MGRLDDVFYSVKMRASIRTSRDLPLRYAFIKYGRFSTALNPVERCFANIDGDEFFNIIHEGYGASIRSCPFRDKYGGKFRRYDGYDAMDER